MRRPSRAVPAAAAALLLLAACGTASGESDGIRAETAEQRAAAIYAAALQKFTSAAPRAVGHPADMYVLDRAYEQAGLVFGADAGRGEPIPPAVQQALDEAMVGTADLTWVADEDDVLRDDASAAGIPCSFVRDGDLVVTLDRLPAAGDSIAVSVAAAGHELDHHSCVVWWIRTYVVAASDDGWQVTGETVPQGVS